MQNAGYTTLQWLKSTRGMCSRELWFLYGLTQLYTCVYQRSVTSLFHSDSKYSKSTILAHSVACSRMLSYYIDCTCSEGTRRVRYCDNHAQRMQ